MDDDIDVSAEASKIVSSIVGMDEIYIGSYAVQLYVKFLMKNLELEIIDKVCLLLFVLFNEEKLSLESSDDDFNEFQIFEKSESNNTKEWFLIRDYVVSTIKGCAVNEIMLKFEDFCKRIDQTVDFNEMDGFLRKLNL